MTRLILHIFNTLRAHRLLCWGSLLVSTAVLCLLLTRQSYKEDISDFLPLDSAQQVAFQTFQEHSGARRIYVVFDGPDTARESALELYCDLLDSLNSTRAAIGGDAIDYMTADDPAAMEEALRAVYARIPYLLTDADYARIDSLTRDTAYVDRQLTAVMQRMSDPWASMMETLVWYDPLQLFTPALQRLLPSAESVRHMLFVDSPYGASETECNGRLTDQLQLLCDGVVHRFPSVSVRLTGGPIVAVGNARQIQTDSVRSISIALVLILLLLWYVFRSVRHLLLIALSIGWGWLFAMGCMALVPGGVSMIVVGISSVILGIAVNYPLHLIAHLPHAADLPTALREITPPLLVGNVTTVGAFLALMPLNAVALRHLGLFSACLLVGTIVFVLLWLPHMVRPALKPASRLLDRVSAVALDSRPRLVWLVVVLTAVLGWFSLQTTFDADLHNINFMTDKQRYDMQSVELLTGASAQGPDQQQSLHQHGADAAQLRLWNRWRTEQGQRLCRQIEAAADRMGFADNAFSGFRDIVFTSPKPQPSSLTSSIVANLSDNFNYIGWACGGIVFLFLWLSLGSIELALLSFLPMAVSWVWILGLMGLFGLHFNVVNVILATFIFGQGDDYTIFMTEGCQYEYSYRRPMLRSYRRSIIVSALIMFTGIGTLVFARHPALFSLAQVTVVGMFSVVLMACLLPPLIFRWLVYHHGRERRFPLTLRSMLCGRGNTPAAMVADCYRYRGADIYRQARRQLHCFRSEDARRSMLQHSMLPGGSTVVLLDCGYGAAALCLALEWPGLQFVAVEKDTEKLLVARHVADGRVNNITFTEDMKEMIRTMLEDALPLVDFDADFLFSQLDSLGVTTILMTLSDAYGITLDATDATPRNLMSLDAIATLVETKLKEKDQ